MTPSATQRSWINPEKARYYQVFLDQDLFGDWTLIKVWGGTGSNRGRMHSSGVASYGRPARRDRSAPSAPWVLLNGYRLTGKNTESPPLVVDPTRRQSINGHSSGTLILPRTRSTAATSRCSPKASLVV